MSQALREMRGDRVTTDLLGFLRWGHVRCQPHHLGHIVVPLKDADPHQPHQAIQRGQHLLGDVVGDVDAQGGVMQKLPGLTHQLNEGQPWRPVDNDIGNALAHPRLCTAVLLQSFPGRRKKRIPLSQCGKVS